MTQEPVDTAMLGQLQELLGARFCELVDRYSSDGSRRIELLRQAIAAGDLDTVHAEAHGLKGSSRNVGANALGDLCAELEEKGRNCDDEGLGALFAAVEQEFAAVCTRLRSYC